MMLTFESVIYKTKIKCDLSYMQFFPGLHVLIFPRFSCSRGHPKFPFTLFFCLFVFLLIFYCFTLKHLHQTHLQTQRFKVTAPNATDITFIVYKYVYTFKRFQNDSIPWENVSRLTLSFRNVYPA